MESDITGLEVFEIEVDGDDPRWGRIDRSGYTYCNPHARPADFLVKPGKRRVMCGLFPAYYFHHDPSNQEVVDEINRRHLTRSDRAVTETVLDARHAELVQKPIVGICGVVRTDAYGHDVIGTVVGRAGDRYLGLCDLQDRRHRSDRFLVLVAE